MTGQEYGPADVVIDEDGTTWVRISGHGVEVLANLDKLRESMAPPVGPIKFRDEDFPRPRRLDYVDVFGGWW